MTDTQKIKEEIDAIRAQLNDKKAELKASQEAEILEIKDEIISKMELALFPEIENMKREKIDAKLARFRQMRTIFLNEVLENLPESASHNYEEIVEDAPENFEQNFENSEVSAPKTSEGVGEDAPQNLNADNHESSENRDWL